ncbi:hypothetical protein D3C81_10010 [compost metagenome]
MWRNRRKQKGNFSILMLWGFLLLLLMGLYSFIIETYSVNAKAHKIQDDIVISNLATYKLLDMTSLAETPRIFKIVSPANALATSKIYLQKNMNLNSDMTAKAGNIVTGEVKIKEYILYNVSYNKVEIWKYNSNTNTFNLTTVADKTVTPVTSPNGVTITNTAIYTVLNVNVEVVMKGLLGESLNQNIAALTDIKGNE